MGQVTYMHLTVLLKTFPKLNSKEISKERNMKDDVADLFFKGASSGAVILIPALVPKEHGGLMNPTDLCGVQTA